MHHVEPKTTFNMYVVSVYEMRILSHVDLTSCLSQSVVKHRLDWTGTEQNETYLKT
jgi:hypothetical protein